MKTPINTDTARMLAHAALLAAWEGKNDAANQIFSALERARPKEPNVRLCRALVLAFQDKYAECTALLEQVLREQPGNVTAKGLLGFVMFTEQRRGWQKLLEEVVQDGSDPMSARVATSILEQHGDRRAQAPARLDPRAGPMRFA